MPVGAEWPSSDRSGSPRPRPTTPKQLGRYEIVEPIAGGGMGFVYAAYDPELDRKVALKVVHPRRSHNPASHSRLIKEARALARLDHPNVVKVHDVFSHDEQIVVVMELVEGVTLEQWEVEKPRTWREIVDVYVQAGEGLAAAHALDIVHRDFKPANAVVGSDGRVRVLDFGLARITNEELSDGLSEPTSGAITKTIPGTIMGTLAYASPEQLAGEDTTTSSDQFSFCAALHFALERKRPFAGETARELASAIKQGHPTRSDRPLPTWLRFVIERGLAAMHEQRYPSMAALLYELKKPRGWRRWRRHTFAASSLGLAAFAVGAAFHQPARADSCDTASIADVWQPSRLVGLVASLDAPSVPFADDLAHKAVIALDDKARQWGVTARNSCLAHRSATLSDPMYDRQTTCLAERKAELAAAVEVLASGTTATHATEVVSGIENASDCLDLTRVFALEQVPAALRDNVRGLRARLHAAAALTRAARFEEAQAMLTPALADARASGYAPVLAESQLALGRLYIAEHDHERAIPILRAATTTALANNLTAHAVEAIARRIYAETELAPDRAQFERDYELAEPLSRAAADSQVRALFLNNIGTAYLAVADRDRARALFRDAAASLVGTRTTDIELSAIAYNLALMTREAPERIRLLDEVTEQRTLALGKHHPFTLEARAAAALLGDEQLARERLPDVCNDYRTYRASMPATFAMCEQNLALLAERAGDGSGRRRALSVAIETRDVDGPLGALLEGELAVIDGANDRAHALLVKAIEESTGIWTRVYRAEAHYYLAKLATSSGDRKGAAEHARAALESYRTLASTDLSFSTPIRVVEAEQLVQGQGVQ